MSLGEQIQKFLEEKFKKYNKDQFFKDVGFSRATAGKILNADHRNPEFKTILKIAKYFNCSVDEVIKRKKKFYKKSKNYKFKDISLEEIQLGVPCRKVRDFSQGVLRALFMPFIEEELILKR